MYRLYPKFKNIGMMTGMLTKSTKKHYKDIKFKTKPTKEEIKTCIVNEVKKLDKLTLPTFEYVLSKDNEELYLFDRCGEMIKNYKFEQLIQKIYSKSFLLELKAIEEFEEEYLDIKKYLSNYLKEDELIITSYHFASRKSTNKKKIRKKLETLNIKNPALVDIIFKYIINKKRTNDEQR